MEGRKGANEGWLMDGRAVIGSIGDQITVQYRYGTGSFGREGDHRRDRRGDEAGTEARQDKRKTKKQAGTTETKQSCGL